MDCIICGNSSSRLKFIIDSYRIVQCRTCALVYLQNPTPHSNDFDTYNHYFEQSGVAPYASDSPNPAMRILWELNEQRLAFIRSQKNIGSILDVGCGRGYFMHHAAGMGYEVEGIEVSPLAAAYAEEKYHLKLHVQSVQDRFETDKKFDIITLWHVLEHFFNPLTVLINLRDHLKEDGLLIIEVPNIRSLKFMLSSKKSRWIGGNHPRHHRYFFSHRSLALLLEKAGLGSIQRITKSYDLSTQGRCKTIIKRALKSLDMDSFINMAARNP